MATPQEVYDRLRSMSGTDADTYPDSALDVYLEEALVEDAEGNDPGDEDYVETYDLHRAAALIWWDRAAEIARFAFDTQIDMTRAARSDVYENFHRMARHHEMKARARSGTPTVDAGVVEVEDNVSGDT